MKKYKILSVPELKAIGKRTALNIHIYEVHDEHIKTKKCSPIYESGKVPVYDKIDNAIIALPSNLEPDTINEDTLAATITEYANNLNIKGNISFCIGNFFAGDYTSGESRWNTYSLCVSLYGVISDSKTTIAIAKDIFIKHNLPRVLIVFDGSTLEFTKEGEVLATISENHIKRLYES